MKQNRTPSGITVTVPDISAPLAQALQAFNKEQLEDGELPASELTFGTFGYVLTKQGMFVLCTEGVGDSKPITPDNRYEVDLHTPNTALVCAIKFTDTELIMLPTAREVPLEDFIRQFGGRLESNYSIWLAALRKAEPMTLESSS